MDILNTNTNQKILRTWALSHTGLIKRAHDNLLHPGELMPVPGLHGWEMTVEKVEDKVFKNEYVLKVEFYRDNERSTIVCTTHLSTNRADKIIDGRIYCIESSKVKKLIELQDRLNNHAMNADEKRDWANVIDLILQDVKYYGAMTE
ncbi:MAG: hypothetical protein ACXAC2_03730 [Candidatus Kariarchaeaceae archaeon]|jgi:hypothetical protein